jgi:excisionase family DNA binding protein
LPRGTSPIRECVLKCSVQNAEISVFQYITILETIENRDTLLTVDELSKLLSMSGKTLYKAIKAGRLAAYRIGGIRLDPHDVADWLRNRRTKK